MKDNNNKLVVIDTRGVEKSEEPATAQDNSPGALLRLALERDLQIEKIEKLLELQERWDAQQARKAYVQAMSEFKRENCPVIAKDRHVSFRNSKGQLVEYDHASLAQVVGQCTEGLALHGFHHDWETRQEKSGIEVSCIVTHKQGHSTRKTLSAPPDQSGTKNQIQAIASTVTYLQRYTLLMALGLAPADDDDARAAEEPAGKAEPPVDRDPKITPRARRAVEVWQRYLGKDARHDMETYLGKPAGLWDDADFQQLMTVWNVVKSCETPEQKTAALRSALERKDPQ